MVGVLKTVWILGLEKKHKSPCSIGKLVAAIVLVMTSSHVGFVEHAKAAS